MNGRMVHIQTDNGSEFHLNFMKAAEELGLQHWWSRTHTPKDNAVCERFNRTLQEEFIAQGNAYGNVDIFNQKLADWLTEYDCP
jgi:transposase InsO family protein